MAPNGDGPREKYQQERERVEREAEGGEFSEADADLVLEFLEALDPEDYSNQPGEIGTKSFGTLEAYAQNLRLTAKAADADLADLTPGDLNAIYSQMGERLSPNTVQQRQASARVFYRYHGQLGVDPEAIFIVQNEPTPVDPRDLFSREEIDAMREVIDNPRDRAIVDLGLYTGQRIRAIQTLRIQDVDVRDGRFYLNPEAFGLKGAKGMRSLLIAKGACAEWVDYHPAPNDPDAYFISNLPDSARGDPHSPLYQSTINRRIEAICKRADVERPEERGHAHNLRHTFVRWAYVNREMDLSTIKWMMGHAMDSRTLEETYFNILDRDHAKKAEEAAGVRSPEEEGEDITPDSCPVCDHALPAHAKACPRCGTVLTPDAAEAQKSMQEQAEGGVVEVDDEQEARVVQAVLKDLRENPGEFMGE